MKDTSFLYNVFINIPFDSDYFLFRNAIIFTILDCGFFPKCALEEDDSGSIRVDKIKKLIKDSKYGIHDISRTELSSNGLPRFNMPLELGVFMGAKYFGNKQQKSKVCLVLDKEEYRYQAFISDIAGQDIKSHDDDLNKLIKCIRDWLNSQDKTDSLPGPADIIQRLNDFYSELPKLCKAVPIKKSELTYNDYIHFISIWLEYNTRG